MVQNWIYTLFDSFFGFQSASSAQFFVTSLSTNLCTTHNLPLCVLLKRIGTWTVRKWLFSVVLDCLGQHHEGTRKQQVVQARRTHSLSKVALSTPFPLWCDALLLVRPLGYRSMATLTHFIHNFVYWHCSRIGDQHRFPLPTVEETLTQTVPSW